METQVTVNDSLNVLLGSNGGGQTNTRGSDTGDD